MWTLLAFDDVLQFGAHCAVKGGAVLAVACVAYFAMRRASSARRHLVLGAAVCGVLALPLLAALFPRVDIAVLPRPAAAPPVAAPISNTVLARLAVPAPQPTLPQPKAQTAERGTPPGSPLPVVPARGAPRINGALLLVAVWGLGACTVFLPMFIGLVGLRGRTRRAHRFADGSWAALLDEGARELRVRRPVRLLQSEGNEVPITWGMLRPVILLPAEAESWPEARKRVVLQHELAHIKRGDFATQLLGRLVCACHWFNPLAWFAARALHTESEGACDDLVLSAGSRPPDYAEHLLDIARTLRPVSSVAFVGIAMARTRRIERRVRAIIDGTRNRRSVTGRALVLTLAMALAVAWGAAVLHPTARAESDKPVHLDKKTRERNMKQMGLVFKMYATESRGERFPAKSAEHGAFYPELPELWPVFLSDPEILAYLAGERGVALCYLGHVLRNEEETLALLDAHEREDLKAVRDRDLTIGEGTDTLTLYRLREGVERFFITDINDPSSSARAQSEIPILWELADTLKKGGYVLYMDGHVAWQSYPGEFPMTEAVTKRVRAMMNAAPGETTGDGGKLAISTGGARLGQVGRGGGGMGGVMRGGRGGVMLGGRGGMGGTGRGGGGGMIGGRGTFGGSGGIIGGGAPVTRQAPIGADSGGASLSEYLTPEQHREMAVHRQKLMEEMALATAAQGDTRLERSTLNAAVHVLRLQESLKQAREQAQRLPGGAASGANADSVVRLTQALRRGESAVHKLAQAAAGNMPRLRIVPSGGGTGPSAYLTLAGSKASGHWTRVDAGDEFEGLRVDEIISDEGAVRLTDVETGKSYRLTASDLEWAQLRAGDGALADWAARQAAAFEREVFARAERSLAEEREAAARHRSKAGSPEIKVTGFFEDAKTGTVTAFLEVEGLAHGQKMKVAVQEGDAFEGLRLDKIIEDRKGIRVMDLVTGEASTIMTR